MYKIRRTSLQNQEQRLHERQILPSKGEKTN